MNKEELKEQIKNKQGELKKLIIPFCQMENAERLANAETEKRKLKWYQWHRKIKLNKELNKYYQIGKLIEQGNFELLCGIPFNYNEQLMMSTTLFIKMS